MADDSKEEKKSSKRIKNMKEKEERERERKRGGERYGETETGRYRER